MDLPAISVDLVRAAQRSEELGDMAGQAEAWYGIAMLHWNDF